MPTRLCIEAGCASEPVYRGRCQAHQRQTNKATHRNRHVYGRKRWKMLRRHVLFETPLCERCGLVATDVHHIKDIAGGGDPWDRQNLEALCHGCHSAETRRRQVNFT